MVNIKQLLIALLLSAVLLAGCSSAEESSGAARAVQEYNQALVEKDANRLSSLSCADWEAEAQNELASFGAVTTALNELTCTESGTDGEITLVSCTGTITANYGNEVLEIDLSERTYQVVFEAGEWRMCGYR
jgi:outer membrane murein-binding lipoprotein Lpp